MAVVVTDETLYHTTTDLILPSPQKFYLTRICAGHLQLRSLISSPRPNIVYYPTGKDVVVLNTKSRESYILTTLKFEPRCLIASKEWLFCGGQKGDYTAIRIGERNISENNTAYNSGPDAHLPLDLDPSRRTTSSSRSGNDVQTLEEINRTIGADIVNCITIWQPSETPSERTYQEPVAIASNNDRSVSIMRLDNSELLDILLLPDCVNRSMMSPDGEMLISICDDPFLYVHRRKLRLKSVKNELDITGSYHWSYEGKVQLEKQNNADISEPRGSFAATFSPSGKYLAVATQFGIISVFKTDKIFESPICIFTSSRPNLGWDSCIRAMEFSGGPFDLLAWTESKGRVGVADVRNFFQTRQSLNLDPNFGEVEIVLVVNKHFDLLESSRRRRPDPCRIIAAPFNREEVDILEAHQNARQQRVSNSRQGNLSMNSAWRSSSDSQRLTTIPNVASSNSAARSTSPRLPVTLREFLSQDHAPSFRTFINERNREHDRLNQQGQDVGSRRRTYAQTLTESDNLNEQENSRSLDDGVNILERLRLMESRRSESEPENLWAQARSRYFQQRHAANVLNDPLSPPRIELEEDDQEEFLHRLRQPWRGIEELNEIVLDAQGTVPAPRNRSGNGNDGFHLSTTGCCWSQDGRILYAGTEDGIHEFHVNIEGRKRFPSLVFC